MTRSPFRTPCAGKHAGKARDLIEQLAIGERPDDSGHRAIVNERRLIRPPAFDMTIERIVASVEQSAGEPSIERRPRVIEYPVPLFIPVNRVGRLGPEISRDRSASGYRRRHRYLSWRSLRRYRMPFLSLKDRAVIEPIPTARSGASAHEGGKSEANLRQQRYSLHSPALRSSSSESDLLRPAEALYST